VERDSALIIRKVPAANNATIVVLVEPLTVDAINRTDEIAQTLITELQQSLIDQNRSRTFGIEMAIQNIQQRLTTNTQNQHFEDKPVVAIACIEVLEDQAIIGLVGTTHCFLRDGDELFSLTTKGHAAAAPIGATNTPTAVRFFNTNLRDQQLLLTTSTTRFDESLEEIMTKKNTLENTWADIVNYVRDIPHASAVLLTWQTTQSEYTQGSIETPVNTYKDSGQSTHSTKFISLKEALITPIKKVFKNWKLIFLSLAFFIGLLPLYTNIQSAGRIDFWNQYDQLVLDIQILSREAISNSDKSDSLSETRSYLNSALLQINTGLSITPDDKKLSQLETEILDRLNTLGISKEVTSLQTLVTFKEDYQTNRQITTIAFGGGRLWSIDQSNGQVLESNLKKTEYSAVIYHRGDTYQGTPADIPLSIAWDELRDRLIILDANGAFFAYRNAGNGLPRPLGLPRNMSANQILKITVSKNSLLAVDSEGLLSMYELEVNALRPNVELLLPQSIPDVLSINLGKSGNPLLLTSTKFMSLQLENQVVLEIEPAPPIKLATTLATDPVHVFAYVVEPEQRRILVVDAEHTLIGIYRHPTFAEIIDIASDNEVLYLLTESKILRFVKIFEGE
jgi:hypothetical protein